ncbi:MAG TPA: methionine--tRNA ligase [Hadesarchaea archaeon]|nr:methionine--tRNA ligase [Hadesarchaea archaeon]
MEGGAMKFYVTTPIYYINATPHVGHAYTTVAADVVARWHRLKGDDVFFLTGLDENSIKTMQAAKEKGFKNIQEYADSMAKRWIKTWNLLNIRYDDFIRTTEERHRENVYELFRRIKNRGDIYKGVYEGLYCDGCETYIAEGDLVDGKCPLHQKKPRRVKEENYFFRLSKYRDKLLKHIETHPEFIQPEARRNEVMSFLKGGLKDISVTRPSLEWGIKTPDDPTQIIWVWLDALCNYLLPRQYWPADVHIIAKDILRFHCVIWPSLLLSAGYELPKQIFAHGFLTIDGKKISKSLGNAIDPVYLAEKYSVDVLRYFLIREISFGQDGDFSERGLRVRLNDELADVLGNFVHRVLTFTKTRFDGKLPNGKVDKKFEEEILRRVEKIEQLFGELKLTQVLEETMSMARRGNEYFQSFKPWETVKKEPQKTANCILNCANLVKILCITLSPFMPSTSENMARQLGIKITGWSQAKRFDLKPGHEIGKPSILFTKVKENSPGHEDQKVISMEEFEKLDIRIGRIKSAEKVQKSKKLVKLEVDMGKEVRTLVAGVSEHYSPADLIGKNVAVVTNLKPAKLMGITSQGMLLAAEDEKGISILVPDRDGKPGSKVR